MPKKWAIAAESVDERLNMSYVFAAPGAITAAAQNLASIDSALGSATAAAAIPTIEVVPAGADEISIVLSEVFGAYGQDFSHIAARLRAYHQEFVELVNNGVTAYLDAEAGASTLLSSAPAPIQSLLSATPVRGTVAAAETAVARLAGDAGHDVRAAATALRSAGGAGLVAGQIQAGVRAVSGTALGAPAAASSPAIDGVYHDLFANTVANLQKLNSTWSADPAPLLRQFVANQQAYAHAIGEDLAGFLQHFPASLVHQARTVIEALAAFNPQAFLNQLILNQTGYLHTIGTSVSAAAQDFRGGLDALTAALQSAYHAFAAGDLNGAFDDITGGLGNLLLTGFDVQQTGPSTFSVTALGTLGDLLPIFSIPGQIAQNVTDLVVAPSVAALVSQNLTNVVSALTDTSIGAGINLVEFGLTADFGLPLALGLQALGGPVAALSAANTSVTAFSQAVQASNAQAAFGALIDAPGVIANGYLNGETTIPLTMSVAGLPIELNLPFDGILVPQGSYTATILGIPVAVTGTPIGGIVPALVNYLPQQLAAAIAPVE